MGISTTNQEKVECSQSRLSKTYKQVEEVYIVAIFIDNEAIEAACCSRGRACALTPASSIAVLNARRVDLVGTQKGSSFLNLCFMNVVSSRDTPEGHSLKGELED